MIENIELTSGRMSMCIAMYLQFYGDTIKDEKNNECKILDTNSILKFTGMNKIELSQKLRQKENKEVLEWLGVQYVRSANDKRQKVFIADADELESRIDCICFDPARRMEAINKACNWKVHWSIW